MSDQTADEAASASWETLEDRIDRIIERNRTLASENKALRQAQRKWSVERADLVRRNELAKSRIEAMINRLKLLTDE
ncbi:MAG: TIGR02449 family protein [Gammaproteobacteria bacterium]|nr:TIGR02449 family protein [Gammaproteobacteria bacterium]MCY4342867.1 TIGR02449 family protein [Gammaproteobacteria bacterium]